MVKETIIRISTPNQDGIEHKIYRVKSAPKPRKIICKKSNLAFVLAINSALNPSNREFN